jgi:hypothetical protein
MRPFGLVVFAAALLMPGCSLLFSDGPALRLETDRERYELATSETIVVEVRNVSSAVIYFNRCMPTALEEIDDGRVAATLGFPMCLCLCRSELEPDESWTHGVSVGWIERHRDRLTLKRENQYRLRLAFFEDKEMKRLLDTEALLTNRFEITD